MRAMKKISAAFLVGYIVAGSLLLVGCAPPGEEVHTALCRDLVEHLTAQGGSVQWLDASTDIRRDANLTVILRFAGDNGPRQAACHFDQRRRDSTARSLSDPLSEFSTSPSAMTLDGRAVGRARLAEAVKQAMRKQGHETLERVRAGLDSLIQDGSGR